MIKIVPYKKEHIDLMTLREHEQSLMLSPQVFEALEGGIAETAIVDGRVVCAYGAIPTVEGIANIWLIPSAYVQAEAPKVARGAKKFLEEIRADLNLHRMETVCLADDLHDRWMTFLGFTHEGVKANYFRHKTYNCWGRVWA